MVYQSLNSVVPGVHQINSLIAVLAVNAMFRAINHQNTPDFLMINASNKLFTNSLSLSISQDCQLCSDKQSSTMIAAADLNWTVLDLLSYLNCVSRHHPHTAKTMSSQFAQLAEQYL
jgi:hypothetical protein